MGGEIDRLGLKCIVHRGEDPPAARRHCPAVLDPLWRGVSMRKQRDGEKDMKTCLKVHTAAHVHTRYQSRGRPPKHPPTYTHMFPYRRVSNTPVHKHCLARIDILLGVYCVCVGAEIKVK